jgi:hypothetical protein
VFKANRGQVESPMLDTAFDCDKLSPAVWAGGVSGYLVATPAFLLNGFEILSLDMRSMYV